MNHLVLGSSYTPDVPSKILKGEVVPLDSKERLKFTRISEDGYSNYGSISYCEKLLKSVISYYDWDNDLGISKIIGSQTSYTFYNNPVDKVSTAYDSTTEHLVVSFYDGSTSYCNYGVLGTGPDSITYTDSNKLQINATSPSDFKLIYNPLSTKTIIAFYNGDIKAKIVNNTSGAITYGTEATLESTSGIYLDASSSDDAGFLVIYTDSDYSVKGNYITASGSTLTVDDAYTITDTGMLYCKCVHIVDNSYLVCWLDYDTCKCKIIKYVVDEWVAGDIFTIGIFDNKPFEVSYNSNQSIASIFYREEDTLYTNIIDLIVSGYEVSLKDKNILTRNSSSSSSFNSCYNPTDEELNVLIFDSFGYTFKYNYNDYQDYKGISTSTGIILPSKGDIITLTDLELKNYYIGTDVYSSSPDSYSDNVFQGVSTTSGLQVKGNTINDYVINLLAGEAISTNDPVKIIENKAYKIKGFSVSTAVNVLEASVTLPKLINIDDEKFVSIYHDGTSLKYKILTIDEDSITVGSQGTIGAGYNASLVESIYNSTYNILVIVYKSSDNRLYSVGGSISGTSITFGSAVTITTSNISNLNLIYDENASKAVVIYSTSTGGYARTITSTTTSLSVGTEYLFNSDTDIRSIKSCYHKVNKTFELHYQESSTWSYFIIGQVSGTAISYGSTYEAVSEESLQMFYDEYINRSIAISDADTSGLTYYIFNSRGTSPASRSGLRYTDYNITYYSNIFDKLNERSSIIYYDNSTNNLNFMRYTFKGKYIRPYGSRLILNDTITGLAASYSSQYHKAVIVYGISGYLKCVLYTPDDRKEFIGFSLNDVIADSTLGIRLKNSFELISNNQESGTEIYLDEDGVILESPGLIEYEEFIDSIGIQISDDKGLLYVK